MSFVDSVTDWGAAIAKPIFSTQSAALLQNELAQVLQIESFVFRRGCANTAVWRGLDTNESEIADA
jgi:hypothetical protein